MKKFSKLNEEFEQEPLSGTWTSVLTETPPVHYIDECKMLNFIEANSDMEWNDICDYVRDKGICGEEGKQFWSRGDGDVNSKNECYMWVGRFFEAHPWLEDIVLVFDD